MTDSRNILFVTALPFEGACVRRYLALEAEQGVLPTFSNSKYHLVVSGTGKARCAAATGALCSRFEPDAIDAVVNIGIAGAVSDTTPVGSAWLINQICDAATNRNWYPDMLAAHEMSETRVTTFDRPVTKETRGVPETGLVDMEASAFFQAASLFVGPEKIITAKVVSDILLNPPGIDTNVLTQTMEDALPIVVNYINKVSECNTYTRLVALSETHMNYMQTLCNALQLTRTQQEQLRQSVTHYVQKYPNATLPEFIPARVMTARERNTYFAQFQKELLR
ncbi:MAG: hypothetical protein JXR76_25190 [Deltaproteobacteria bacterium]|nr:hypothetical protein [Deltaproteobacteria bacterium]